MNNSKAHHRNDALRMVHKGSYLQRTRRGNLSLHHFSEHEICYGRILTWSSDWSIRSRRHQDPSQEFSGLFFAHWLTAWPHRASMSAKGRGVFLTTTRSESHSARHDDELAPSSLAHVVGACEQHWRNANTECLRRLQV